MNVLESSRENFRKQLANQYKRDLENGSLTIADIQQIIDQLQTALEKAKKTNRRVLVEGQEHMGSLSAMEIEDQISALRRIL
jgi:adenylosuccinate synthase